MPMKISKIEFENFRNFKDRGQIRCSTDGKVTIIYGKIGDGKTTWRELDNLLVSKETIDKWCTIAKGVTSSHLVTLPNINFAYTTVNVDSNPLVE